MLSLDCGTRNGLPQNLHVGMGSGVFNSALQLGHMIFMIQSPDFLFCFFKPIQDCVSSDNQQRFV
jgi:hypothetical protein